MKKLTLFSILFSLFCHIEAKVVYLDNTKDKDATNNLFDTFSDAYTACTSDGDTIYAIGSIENYGTATITKPIVLIGPGYFLRLPLKISFFNNLSSPSFLCLNQWNYLTMLYI